MNRNNPGQKRPVQTASDSRKPRTGGERIQQSERHPRPRQNDGRPQKMAARNVPRKREPERRTVPKPRKIIRTPLKVRAKAAFRRFFGYFTVFLIFYIIFALIYVGYVFINISSSSADSVIKSDVIVETVPANGNANAKTVEYDGEELYFDGELYIPFKSLSSYTNISEIGDDSSRTFIFDGSGISEEKNPDINDIISSSQNTDEVLPKQTLRCYIGMSSAAVNKTESFLKNKVVFSNGYIYLPLSFYENYVSGINIDYHEDENYYYIARDNNSLITLRIPEDKPCDAVAVPEVLKDEDKDEVDE